MWIRITLHVILSSEVENFDTWVPFNSWLAVILSRRFERVVDACFAVLCGDRGHISVSHHHHHEHNLLRYSCENLQSAILFLASTLNIPT